MKIVSKPFEKQEPFFLISEINCILGLSGVTHLFKGKILLKIQ